MKFTSSSIILRISLIYKFVVNLIDNPITISIALASATIPLYYYYLSPFFLGLQLTVKDYDKINQFIEWFGVPYGLLLALVMVNVWSQFDTTDRAFDREADAILAFYDTFLLTMDIKLQEAVTTKIIEYIKHVNDHYSEEYAGKKNKYKEHGFELLNDMRKIIGDLIKKKENQVLIAELLRLMNELIDDRGDRLTYSKQQMPKPVLFLSYIASALWLIPYFALDFTHPSVGIFFVGGVTLVVVSILSIVIDLDNPFSGTWTINLKSWDDLLDTIK